MAPASMSAFDFQKRCKGNDYFLSCKSLEIFFRFFLLWGRKGRVVKPSSCRGSRVVGLPFLRPVGAHPPAPLGAPFAPRYPDFLRLCHTELQMYFLPLRSTFLSSLLGFSGALWAVAPKMYFAQLTYSRSSLPRKKRPHLQRIQVGGALFANQLAIIATTHLVWW